MFLLCWALGECVFREGGGQDAVTGVYLQAGLCYLQQ
jgi:hypothetical protein